MSFRGALFLAAILATAQGCGGEKSDEPPAPQAAPAIDAVDPAIDGAVTGIVTFTGAAPKRKRINMKADAVCSTRHAENVYSEEIVVNPNGTLRNVYVHVKSGLGNLQYPVPAEPAILDQNGCIYVPHVLGVQAGQEIHIRNSDDVLHNVHAQPKNNKPFNIGQPVKGMVTTKKFGNPEIGIPVKCDVHPWMGGYISVESHPYFSVTGEDGGFALLHLPPGNYEIEAWHERYGTAIQKVSVGPKEKKDIRFSFSGS